MDLNDITSLLATGAVFFGAIFVTVGHKKFPNSTILLLWMMALSSFTWGLIPLWLNDVMYDLTFILLTCNLVMKKDCLTHKLTLRKSDTFRNNSLDISA